MAGGGGGTSQSTTVTQSTSVTVNPQFFIDLTPVQKAIDAISGVQTRQIDTLQNAVTTFAGQIQQQAQTFNNALAAEMQWSLVLGAAGLLVMIYFQRRRR